MDVVFTFSFETLDDAVAREFCRPPDRVLCALAHDPRTVELSVVDPWRSVVVDLVRRRASAPAERVLVAGRDVTRIRPRRLRRRDPQAVGALERWSRTYARQVGRALKPGRRAVLVTFNPFVAAWAQASWIERRIYVGRDDWLAHPPMRPWAGALRDAYRRIDRQADAIFAVSQELADRLSRRAVVVPNGIDSGVWGPDRKAPRWMRDILRPCAVYTGSIDDRLDLAIFERIARHGLLGSVLVVGPVSNPGLTEALRRIPKVRLVGQLGQQDLAALVGNVDIGLVPHVVSDQTTAMSPLKLYEYLAGGLPVVATDLPPVRHLGERVHLCRAAEQWHPALEMALAQGKQTGAARAAVVEQLSWSRRLAPILDAALDSDAPVRPRI